MEDVEPHNKVYIQNKEYFDEMDVGVIIVNISERVEYINSTFEKHFNVKKDALLGKPIKQFTKPFNISRWFTKNHQSDRWIAVTNDSTKHLIKIVHTPCKSSPYFIMMSISLAELSCFIPQLDHYACFHDELQAILDCVYDGIYVTDGEGNTIMLNKAAEKTGGKLAGELIGKNMSKLVDEGYCSESVSLKVIKERNPVTIVQKLNDGTELLVSGVPYIKNGVIDMVITSERDITELNTLRKQSENQKNINIKVQSELQYLRSQNAEFDDLIFESAQMSDALDLALRVAKLDTTILIQGDSGVGKEVFAKVIYNNSSRKKGPFIKVNCGAIPESLIESELFGYESGAFTGAHKDGKPGLFELAHNGTLFLDEISELPLNLQVKLLRAIQEKEIRRVGGKDTISVDSRIIVATNRNLCEAVRNKKFRADLFYRLNVVPLNIPPLRTRKEDIKPLTHYFIAKYNRKYKLKKYMDPAVLDALMEYDWPGNVRELENMVERIIVTIPDDIIYPYHFTSQLNSLHNISPPINFESVTSLKDEVNKFEKSLILSAIPHCSSTEELSSLFDVDRSTIIRKLHKYKIKNVYADR